MKRIEIIEKLQEKETLKTNFDKLLTDVESYYYENTEIVGYVKTKDFSKKYVGQRLTVNNTLFKDYLNSEIKQLEKDINKLIDQLKEC